MSGRRAPRFVPREVPLPPLAVALPRERVGTLAARWRRDGTGLEALRAVAGPFTLLLFGDADLLPWVDGAIYLGQDPEAPRLLVPTALEPDLPMALVERALFAAAPRASVPSALLLDPCRLIDAASPGAVDLASVEGWLARAV